jgi:phosphoribosylanthranilate isomerase
MRIVAKICGINSVAAGRVAAEHGASHVGFVFYPRSPRAVTPAQAGEIARALPGALTRVAVLVDPDDALIADVLAAAPIDLLQLHGGETPARVAEIRARFRLPVMKALAIAGPDDLDRAADFAEAADWLLFEAKPPKSVAAALPGGNGIAFDWRWLAGRACPLPWLLSGGLNPDNVAEAIRVSGARGVDVSSGVEARPGVKDPVRIARFLDAAHGVPVA